MWITYIAPHQDPKKMTTNKNKFLPLGDEKNNSGGVSDNMKQIFLVEYQKYLDKVKKQQ